jgi:hypothetical protein
LQSFSPQTIQRVVPLVPAAAFSATAISSEIQAYEIMCSACSGDPENPPEDRDTGFEWQNDPFWAWWKAGTAEPEGDEKEFANPGGPVHRALRREMRPGGAA